MATRPLSLKRLKQLVGHAFDRMDAYWNDLVAHYRSRVERVIYRVKSHTWCEVAFRGSYALLVQFMEGHCHDHGVCALPWRSVTSF